MTEQATKTTDNGSAVAPSLLNVELGSKIETELKTAFALNPGCIGDEDKIQDALVELNEMRAEITRLRDSLKKIVSHGDYTAPEGMTRIARAALSPNYGGKPQTKAAEKL